MSILDFMAAKRALSQSSRYADMFPEIKTGGLVVRTKFFHVGWVA